MSRDDGKNADFFYDIYGQLDTIHFDAYGYADTTISFGYNTSGERVYKNYVRNYKDSCGGGGGIPQNMNSGSGPEELGAGTMGLGPGGPPPRDTLCDFRDSTYTLYVRSNGKVLAEYGVGRYIPQRKYIYAGDTRNKTTGCSVFIFELVDKDWE